MHCIRTWRSYNIRLAICMLIPALISINAAARGCLHVWAKYDSVQQNTQQPVWCKQFWKTRRLKCRLFCQSWNLPDMKFLCFPSRSPAMRRYGNKICYILYREYMSWKNCLSSQPCAASCGTELDEVDSISSTTSFPGMKITYFIYKSSS